jgi:hypothetical protein
MAPNGGIRYRVSLIPDGIPHLNALGHLSLPNTSIGVIACIDTPGRRVTVSKRYNTGVEGKGFFRHLLAP